jgi:hypothetical protein
MAARELGVGKLGWVLAALCVAVGALQAIRPELNNPPVISDLQAPPEVKRILVKSCYDCHSNETKLLWFDQIVPAYWMVVNDVRTARARLNFSEIGSKPAPVQRAALYESVNFIRLGAMPLASYSRLHPHAAIAPEELAVLQAYLRQNSPPAEPALSGVAAADDQYAAWIASGDKPGQARPTPNGIPFLPGYKNWKMVSITDRFDNQTIRAILANETAVEAMAANRVNPWPDGATFAKVTWLQQPNSAGFVRAGAFFQVEFMIKDAREYATTKGWGWARWRGADLIPYGANAAFSNECTGCHQPMGRNDYVFTRPIPEARPAGDVPSNPLGWKLITLGANRPESTLFALFGNDRAVEYARTSSGHDYPSGSVLTLVTWTQADDDNWFGGRIPGAPKSVEYLTIGTRGEYSYEAFEGTPLRRVSAEGETPAKRAMSLAGLRAAVVP